MKNIKSIDPLFKFELSTSSKSVFSFFFKKKKEKRTYRPYYSLQGSPQLA